MIYQRLEVRWQLDDHPAAPHDVTVLVGALKRGGTIVLDCPAPEQLGLAPCSRMRVELRILAEL